MTVVAPQVPSFRSVMANGLPGFAREGFLPVGLFYAGMKLEGLALGIALSSLAAAGAYFYERHRGREGMLARLSLAFVVVQAGVGLASHSATVYLAQPVLLNAALGFAYLGSVVVGRPLMGAIATAWYPFPPEVRRLEIFRRVFGFESIVWGIYLVARSGVRLAFLLTGSLGSFVIVNAITGLPLTLALVAWSVWYAIRRFEQAQAD